MKNFHQVLMSSPKLLGITSFGAALLVLIVTFGLVNNGSEYTSENQINSSSSIFIVGPGHTQAEIADRFDKKENPLIETAVKAAKDGLNKNSKSVFQRLAEEFAKGYSDGFKGK